MDDRLDYGSRLRRLGEQRANSSALTVGFPGVGGGHMPMVTPPALLLHCPGPTLLHDVVWLSDHVFDLDSDDPLATVPYRLLERLNQADVLQYLPPLDGGFAAEFRDGLGRDAAQRVAVLFAEAGDQVSSSVDLRQALLERTVPEHMAPEQWDEMQSVLRALHDALFLQRLGQFLECSYSTEHDGIGIHVAQNQPVDEDPTPVRAAEIRVPSAMGSILVDESGTPADLVPEATLIQQRVMRGRITVTEPDGERRPFREPCERRSFEAADRLLAVRERAEVAELRRIVRDWCVEVRKAAFDDSDVNASAERCQRKIDRLLPRLESPLSEIGDPAWMRFTVISSAARNPMALRTLGNRSPRRTLHHVARFGPLPSLAGYRVLRGQRAEPGGV